MTDKDRSITITEEARDALQKSIPDGGKLIDARRTSDGLFLIPLSEETYKRLVERQESYSADTLSETITRAEKKYSSNIARGA